MKKQLDSLRRCQSLEEVQKLHEAGDHKKVVELLLSAEEKNKVRRRPLSVKLLTHLMIWTPGGVLTMVLKNNN